MVEQVKTKTEPRVRFRGFTDEWEQVKLGDVVDILNNKRQPVTAGDRISGDTPYYGANGIQDYVEGYTHDGEFILVAEDGANDLVNYPVKYVSGKIWVNNHAHIMLGLDDIAMTRYLAYGVKRINIAPYLVGGGRAKLNLDALRKLKMKLPSLEEQQKIGELFQTLDKAIDLSNTQVGNLKQQKKALLQRLFPQKGETEPTIRLRGFTDEWNEVRLGDVLQKEIKGKAQKGKLVDGDVEYLDANRLNGGEPFLSDNTIDVNCEDILVLWDGSKAGTVYTGFEGALGSTLKAYVVNDDNDSGFVYQWLSLNQDVIYERYRTPNIPHVIKNFTTAFLIYIPSLPEQQAIGELFQTLDEQIRLAEDKVNQYKELKQALLQRLFV